MKQLITIIGFLLCYSTGWTQIQIDREVIGSEGGWGANGSLSLNYSVGEAIISAADLLVGIEASEGFIQPLPLLAAPLSDSVWPGDANHDGVSDQYDLIALGIGYGTTGPIRPNASLNWTAQFAPDWTDSLPTSNVNYKHLDCNGDGLIDDNDTLALHLNFGLTHNKGSQTHGGPPLYTEIVQDSLFAGDTAEVLIFYGADTLPVSDSYGLGFFLDFDTSLVKMSSATVSYPGSFMGQKGQDLLTFHKVLETEGRIAMSLAGNNQLNRSGYGIVGKVTIIMIDDLAGKRTVYEPFRVCITEPQARDSSARLLPLQPSVRDSAVVQINQSVGFAPPLSTLVRVYPNPTQDQLVIQLQGIRAEGYQLSTMLGQIIRSDLSPFQQTTLQLGSLPSGVYLLHIITAQGTIVEKIQIRDQ